MFIFNSKYFALSILLFIVEVLIAAYINDSFVRPYVGDFLVVIFIYCFIKGILKANVKPVALSVLLFAYAIEVLQYFKFLKFLGLQKNKLANIVLGNSFQWADMLAYTCGILLVLTIEKIAPNSGRERLQTKIPEE